jgi:hypothetical protein
MSRFILFLTMLGAARSGQRVSRHPDGPLLLAGLLPLIFVVLLTLLAYGYSPDQTWHGGLYDEDDDDYGTLDLWSTVTAALAEPYRHQDHVPPAVAIGVLIPCDDPQISQPAHCPSESRAPPVR